MYTSVMELYNAYQKDMNAMLISVQEILGNKDKLQEAEGKIMQSQERERNLNQSMIPISRDALSALYGVGKPCSISDLKEMEECINYSNQELAAAMRRMANKGVLGKDFRDGGKLYFYPIPNSLEEAIKILGITEKANKDVKNQPKPSKNNATRIAMNYGELEKQVCNCPCCNKSVSVQAVACPNCGYPVKKNFLLNLYNKDPLKERVTKGQLIVKLWILAQYLDLPLTELPRYYDQIGTWVVENSGRLNRITENDIVALSKSPEFDYEKLKHFLKHEEEIDRLRKRKE